MHFLWRPSQPHVKGLILPMAQRAVPTVGSVDGSGGGVFPLKGMERIGSYEGNNHNNHKTKAFFCLVLLIRSLAELRG